MTDVIRTPTPASDEVEQPNALYRFFSADDTLLYIGITKDLGTRLKTHNHDKAWFRDVAYVRIQHFGRRDEVLAAEIAAIKAEQPLWNVKFNVPGPEPMAKDSEAGIGPDDGPAQLRTEAVATALKVSNSTAIAYTKAGLLRTTRTAGRHRRYSAESVAELARVLALSDGQREPAMAELRARNRGEA